MNAMNIGAAGAGGDSLHAREGLPAHIDSCGRGSEQSEACRGTVGLCESVGVIAKMSLSSNHLRHVHRIPQIRPSHRIHIGH